MNENPPLEQTVPPAPPTAEKPRPVIVEKKLPGLAALLSFFPGLGHLYLGLYSRAFAIAGAFAFSIWMCARDWGPFFGPLVAFIWFFGIIDAVRQANAINRGYVAESGFAPQEQIRKAARGTGGLTWGVILVGLGALALLDRYVDVDWSFMWDWGGPLTLILLGLVLIISHIARKRRENEAGVGLPPRSL